MTRLTKYLYEIEGNKEYGAVHFKIKKATDPNIINALGAYEDLGLTPIEIRERLKRLSEKERLEEEKRMMNNEQ